MTILDFLRKFIDNYSFRKVKENDFYYGGIKISEFVLRM